MSTRKAAVSLREVWQDPTIRQQVAEGVLRLKLPINPSEYPEERAMAGNGFLSGCVGGEDLWPIGPYLISRLYVPRLGIRSMHWGVEFDSSHTALMVFAERVSVDDHVRHEQREIRPYYGAGRQVVVHSLEDSGSVSLLAGEEYSTGRQEGATGSVLCRAQVNSVSYWLVRHQNRQDESTGVTAAYTSRELASRLRSVWVGLDDLREFTDPREVSRQQSARLFSRLMLYIDKVATYIESEGSYQELDTAVIHRRQLLEYFKQRDFRTLQASVKGVSDNTLELLKEWLTHLERVGTLI